MTNNPGRLIDDKSLAACAIHATDRVLVALSGGADSTALLLSMKTLFREGKLGGLFAAHLNHGIRGESALSDQQFCQSLCETLEVPLQTETCDAPNYAKNAGKSLEEAARELRYAFLERARVAAGADCIATAHHKDDQAETLLLHLLRGCGTGGLAGMKPRNGFVARPLLQTSREEILQYLADQNATYCEDETNAQNCALRNRIRNDLLPALREYQPDFVDSLCKTAALCAGDDAYLELLAAQAESQLLREGGLDRALLNGQPQALKSRIVKKRLMQLSGSVSEADIRRVLALSEAQTGTAIELAGGFSAWTSAATLYLGVYPAAAEYEVPFVPEGKTQTPRGIFISERVASWRKPEGADEAYLALDALPQGLVVRSRRAGDRFYPLGAPGERKLSDVFIDKKISREERDRPLLCAGNEVLYAAGLAVSERVKVTPYTREILHITYYRG